MISWMQNKNGQWFIKANNKSMEVGTFEKLILASYVLDISWREMDQAAKSLEDNDHNYAEFGFQKKFTFSEIRK